MMRTDVFDSIPIGTLKLYHLRHSPVKRRELYNTHLFSLRMISSIVPEAAMHAGHAAILMAAAAMTK